MRRGILIFLILVLACFSFAACSGQSAPAGGEQPAQEEQGPSSGSGGIGLTDIRKAAEEAGYKVTDEYQDLLMQEVLDGFSVEIVADEQDVIYSVLECKTEEGAIANAKTIDDAGYNIALRKGKLLTCYGVDLKDGTSKDILASILEGKPIENRAQ